MVHRGIGSILPDGFPAIALQIKRKNHRRGLCRLAIQTYPVKLINRIAAAGEIDFLFSFRASSGDPVSCSAGMSGQFAPLNLLGVMVIDLADPAFVGSNIPRSCSSGVRLTASHTTHGIAQPS